MSRDGLPKRDVSLELLKRKFRLVDREIVQLISSEEETVFFRPKTFMRGEYVCLYISKSVLMAYHRVVWMLHHDIQIPRDHNGELYIVDHFDGNKMNNKPWNLRLATRLENRNNTGQVMVFELPQQ